MGTLIRPNRADNALYVEFFDGEYGEERKPMPYIRIVVDGFTESCFPIKVVEGNEFLRRFPDAWEVYKEKATEKKTGTPLIEMPNFTTVRVKTYANQDIFSVEQLAASSDARLERVMGGKSDRILAVEFLEKKAKDAENEKHLGLQAQMESQAKQIAEQQKMIDKLQLQSKQSSKEK